jgi:hypothetical protein
MGALIPTHHFHQLRWRDRPAVVFHQVDQELIFISRQLQALTVQQDVAALKIYCKVASP